MSRRGADPKWCTGPCGRLLPRAAFYVDKRGWVDGVCLTCRRYRARMDYRRRAKQRRYLQSRADARRAARHAACA